LSFISSLFLERGETLGRKDMKMDNFYESPKKTYDEVKRILRPALLLLDPISDFFLTSRFE